MMDSAATGHRLVHTRLLTTFSIPTCNRLSTANMRILEVSQGCRHIQMPLQKDRPEALEVTNGRREEILHLSPTQGSRLRLQKTTVMNKFRSLMLRRPQLPGWPGKQRCPRRHHHSCPFFGRFHSLMAWSPQAWFPWCGPPHPAARCLRSHSTHSPFRRTGDTRGGSSRPAPRRSQSFPEGCETLARSPRSAPPTEPRPDPDQPAGILA
ncbi:uncharacterized protein LOC144582318 isoform X1 [Callithrix jacchus]